MSGVIVCYAMCWECLSGHHYEPPRWHTWADDDDIMHAESTGQPDPSEKQCGCDCADDPDDPGEAPS